MDGMNAAEPNGIGRSVRPTNRPNVQIGIDVQRFRVLAQTKPRTKAGQVRQVWPEIKVALAAGHRLKDIRTWLSDIGIEIGYARLSDYVGQLKHREATLPLSTNTPEVPRPVATQNKSSVGRKTTRTSVGSDPMSNLQEHERKSALFDFNPEPDAKKLI